MLVDFAQFAKLQYQEPQGAADPTKLWLISPAVTQQGMPGAPDDEAEIQRLVRLAEDERADALGEITAQSQGFIDYFLAAMSISPRSHPRTCRLLYVGSMIGAYVSMHFKGIYQRRRPCQRAPALSPPIRVPGHPSYPSGHATQSRLMVRCLQALPNMEAEVIDVLDVLALRIARNREIAGVHFHSDTIAGRNLANAAYNILSSGDMPQTVPTAIPPDNAAPDTRRFQKLVDDANGEWT